MSNGSPSENDQLIAALLQTVQELAAQRQVPAHSPPNLDHLTKLITDWMDKVGALFTQMQLASRIDHPGLDAVREKARQISEQISNLSGHVSGNYAEIQRMLVKIVEASEVLKSEFSNTRSNVANFTWVVKELDGRTRRLEEKIEKMLSIYESAKRQLNRLNQEKERESQPAELRTRKQKQEKVIELLSDPDGATIPDLMAATGLSSGTCASMISNLRNGRLTGTPIEVITVKQEDQERRYFAR